uniref:DUF2415 domain-containing protein n=1 Tax=Syphacia muris TaxID=451379 RepID=A0A0N5AC34_9BILA
MKQIVLESTMIAGQVVAKGASMLSDCVTSLAFDPYEELLWSGSRSGCVVSYYGAQSNVYTAFVSHPSAIQDVLCTDNAVLTLSEKRLRGHRRQGLPLFTHESENMVDMKCMHRLPDAPHTVVMGGNQQEIVQFDFEKEKEIRIAHLKQSDCLQLRSNSEFLFSSDSDGNITLRDLCTIEPIRTIHAHQGVVSDFDVCGNQLITCGYSSRHRNLLADRVLMVYDLRNFRSFSPVTLPVSSPLQFCRFLPAYSDKRVVAVTQGGQVIVVDPNEATGIPEQLDTDNVALFDISSSGQCIAYGNQTGPLRLCSDRKNPVVNENSKETDFSEPLSRLYYITTADIGDNDSEKPYVAFSAPFRIDSVSLLEWPGETCEQAHALSPGAGTSFSQFNVKPYSEKSS